MLALSPTLLVPYEKPISRWKPVGEIEHRDLPARRAVEGDEDRRIARAERQVVPGAGEEHALELGVGDVGCGRGHPPIVAGGFGCRTGQASLGGVCGGGSHWDEQIRPVRPLGVA